MPSGSINMLIHRRPGDPRSGVYGTPKWFFERINEEFCLEVDVCADEQNTCLPRFWSKKDNALVQRWAPLRCWMNPPYGMKTERFCRKAVREAAAGALVVALLPARTDTHWWHTTVVHAAEIRFYEGRMKFEGMKTTGSFAQVLVIWRPERPFYGPVIRWESIK